MLELEDETKYYLYKVGDVYSDITGGWRKKFQSQYSTLTLNSNRLIFVVHGGNYASNLTDYSKICFEVDNYNINVGTMTTLDSMLLQRNDYGYTTSLCL